MFIKRVKVANFKSFKELDLELDNFNVLVGANASGKTNFVSIFKFLSDLQNFGLENAISMCGGIDYFRNIQNSSNNQFLIEVYFNPEWSDLAVVDSENVFVESNTGYYRLLLDFIDKEPGFKITEDKLTFECKIFESRKKDPITLEQTDKLVDNYTINEEINKERSFTISNPEGSVKKYADLTPIFKTIPPNSTLLELSFYNPFVPDVKFNDLSIYDFEPKQCKNATKLGKSLNLEPDGSNLAIIIEKILKNEEKKGKFLNLVNFVIDFTKDFQIEKNFDGSLSYKLEEIYSEKYLPSMLLSDGTVNIVALIIALYFETEPLSIFEEPDKNIHPYLISRLVEMMKEASSKKQIIVTTHNPILLREAGLGNVLLLSRDKEGCSTIKKPKDSESIKIFLSNDLGLDNLFVDNLLGS